MARKSKEPAAPKLSYAEKCKLSDNDILAFAKMFGYDFPEAYRIDIECVVEHAELGWMNGTEQEFFASQDECLEAYLEGFKKSRKPITTRNHKMKEKLKRIKQVASKAFSVLSNIVLAILAGLILYCILSLLESTISSI
jgi:hypothetical protein